MTWIILVSSAFGANRTVCVELEFRDDRQDCPQVGAIGASHPCMTNQASPYSSADGHRIELWDKDSGAASGDEYIGTWTIGTEGQFCMTFPWEGMPYHKSEADPDVYIRYIYQVKNPYCPGGDCTTVTARQSDGSPKPVVSWRDTDAVQVDCGVGQTCDMGLRRVTTSTSSVASLSIQALDSALLALRRFSSNISVSGNNVNMRVPCDLECDGSVTSNRTRIDIHSADAKTALAPPHEMGHVLQMSQFSQDWLYASCGGDGHGIQTIENQSCVTAEGFADYVAVVSWYNPWSPGTSPVMFGANWENHSMGTWGNCTSAAHTELMVGRAFWDLDDSSNEGASFGWAQDRDDEFSGNIVNGWGNFGWGTCNGCNAEINGDGNAVNMQDYFYNNDDWLSSTAYETLLFHNCTYIHATN